MNPSSKLAKTEDDAAAVAVAVAAEDAVSNVLGNDVLLDEIFLRVGFPTTLVRAAAVCNRWLRHASDKAFLHRFRKLNPPHLLGFYIEGYQGSPRFVPMLPQPPELAAAVRIVDGYNFGAANDGDSVVHYTALIRDCRNGSVSTSSRHGLGVSVGLHSPLCPDRSMAIDRPLSPQHQHPRYGYPQDSLILSREEKDGGLSYFCVLLESPLVLDITSATNFTAHVFILKDGVWCTLASATTQIDHCRSLGVLVDNKIYMLPTYIEITVLDLTNSTFSTIQLPRGVGAHFMIARADDDSGVYLVVLKQHQLGIWFHKGDSWSIVDTICLDEMFANLMMSDCRVTHVSMSSLRIKHVGDNAEIVLLEMDRFALYLDTSSRILRTLYELPEDAYSRFISMQPFMMMWPPTFPALKCDSTRNAM